MEHLECNPVDISMNKGILTGAIYADLSKAFDTIDHNAIIERLPMYRITGTPQKWIYSYLFRRWSYQKILSTPEPTYCGVPQGSILGLLLFLIHFNDATNVLSKCKVVKYADDWLEKNELIINTKKGKTKVMIFGINQRLRSLNSSSLKIERHLK